MIWLGVGIALVGAFGYALGAAMQQYEAAGDGVSMQLMRRPRWWIGGAFGLTGATLHAVALSFAPLIVIQPVSVTTLLFAVPLGAMTYGRRPSRAEIGGIIAICIGLFLLLRLVPESDIPPDLSNRGAIGMIVVVGLIVLIGQIAARFTSRPGLKAIYLGATAGATTATVSFFVRVVGANARTDVSTLLHWFTIAIPVVLAVAAVLLQRSYAVGMFGIAYASAQVIDPITSITAGIVLLGEPLPKENGNVIPTLLAAILLLVGTIALASHAPDRHPRHQPVEPAEPAGPAEPQPDPIP